MESFAHGYENFWCGFPPSHGSSFRGVTTGNAVVYIEDITIFSPTLKQHLVDIDCVLKRMEKENLKVQINKISFARQEVIVLGFKVSKEGIHPNPSKFQGIQDLVAPKDVSGVKEFWECLIFIANSFQILPL